MMLIRTAAVVAENAKEQTFFCSHFKEESQNVRFFKQKTFPKKQIDTYIHTSVCT